MCFRVESEGPKSLAIAVSLLAPEVQVLDMPVDPNEPTYCLCHQVSDAQINTRLIQLSAFLSTTTHFVQMTCECINIE